MRNAGRDALKGKILKFCNSFTLVVVVVERVQAVQKET